MKKIQALFIFIIVLSSFTACQKATNCGNTCCEKEIQIDKNKYNNPNSENYSITSLEINNDCLTVTFSGGGCSGENWEVELIDQGVIMYSNPPQRNLKLSFKSNELCQAYISKEYNFDLRKIKNSKGNSIQLNMANYKKSILYNY